MSEPGPYIQTVGGRRIDPFAPNVSEIDIEDIAFALSNQCRFGGHCRVFYSVAQHSSIVADSVSEQTANRGDQLWALLHDASEAFLTDLPHPLKHRSELGRLYREAEKHLESAIAQRFGLAAAPLPLVKQVDRALLATERRLFSTVAWHWPELDGVTPLQIEIEPWLPEQAREQFLRRYDAISNT
jgi:hypothetical protein